ncbi:MAG: lactate racemase domain-containing protein [Clostridia bacterium]
MSGFSKEAIKAALTKMLEEQTALRGELKKVLILPPDHTRCQSGAGLITAMLWNLLGAAQGRCEVDIMPALGTHVRMSPEEVAEFFGTEIPYEKFLEHDWKHDVVKIGEVPGSFVSEISEGLITHAIDVEVNKRLLDSSYDLIVSVGQVVPHEVVGMANYSKNIFVGVGGSNMINSSHMLGAFYGMERIMGKDFSPVRKVFDYAEEHFIQSMPLVYILTVTTTEGTDTTVEGLYIGRERALFEAAVKRSQEKNLNYLETRPKKMVVYLDEKEFKSTWLGNKSIYRTRMAIADGGELIVLAPGVLRFGEDMENDRLIRKYGYVGRLKVLDLVDENEDLQKNLSVAAHLIHGSSDGRFSITYAVKHLTREEVEGASFRYADYDAMAARYANLKDGWNTLPDGEEVYYISNPALGLWAAK